MADTLRYEKLFQPQPKVMQQKYLNKGTPKQEHNEIKVTRDVELDVGSESLATKTAKKVLELKKHVLNLIKTRVPTDELMEDETTLDDGLSLFINMYRVYILSENDKNWYYIGNESFVELLFDRKKWIERFLLNFPLIFIARSYKRNVMEEFWKSLNIFFNYTPANTIKDNYKQQLNKLYKSLDYEFGKINLPNYFSLQ